LADAVRFKRQSAAGKSTINETVMREGGRMSKEVCWRLHLRSAPEQVWAMLTTNEGRARFWAESAVEANGVIHFRFPNGFQWDARILHAPPTRGFAMEYIGGSVTQFALESDGAGGTELTLTDSGVPDAEWEATLAGWVSVLLALKAAADFGVDLRNHDARRTWEQNFVDN
jgi:uncharacterized protein YndB with AHSA1/START domain